MKLHFYKQGTEPDLPGLRYADQSNGIWGYLAPQSLKWYLGYKDIQTLENELKQAKTDARNGIRGRRTVRQSFNSRY
jgi:hypothetical protein